MRARARRSRLNRLTPQILSFVDQLAAAVPWTEIGIRHGLADAERAEEAQRARAAAAPAVVYVPEGSFVSEDVLDLLGAEIL